MTIDNVDELVSAMGNNSSRLIIDKASLDANVKTTVKTIASLIVDPDPRRDPNDPNSEGVQAAP